MSLSAAHAAVNNNDEFPPHLLHDSLQQKNVSSHPNDAAAAKIETLVPNAVYVVRNVLSIEECQNWINYTEYQHTSMRRGERKQRGTTWEVVSHPATKYIAHRECGRMQKNDWNMSHRLYQRIEHIVIRISPLLNIVNEKMLLMNLVKKGAKKKSSDPNNYNYRPITCNPNLRLYKYTKGQWFGRHVDGSDVVQLPSSNTNCCTIVDGIFNKLSINTKKNNKVVDLLQTEITVLFYLSTCKGGATRFHLPHGRRKNSNSVSFTPQVGAVLLHVHGDNCLEHEAEPVLEGVKYGEST
jgi:hypothetical protein